MKNVIGTPARKDAFYPRKREIAKIEKNLKSGNNIQITAPRRTGKSSILYHFADNPLPNYCFIYIDVEDIRNKNDYYKRIFQELLCNENLEEVTRLSEKIRVAANSFLRPLKSLKIGVASLEINESHDNFEEELINLIQGLNIDELKIVVMIDEFPEVFLNILQRKDGSAREAINFLQSNRALRSNGKINGKIQFIYTGSNSLNMTVAKYDATQYINDLNSISINQLSKEEATDFICQLLTPHEITISEHVNDYLLKKIGWLIPFYIQVIIDSIPTLPKAEITIEDINSAFDEAVELKNKQWFDHYITRLRSLYKGKELIFVKALLAKVAMADNPIKTSDLEKIAAKQSIKYSLGYYLEILESDGYIVRDNDNVQFYSPILKKWWKKHECK